MYGQWYIHRLSLYFKRSKEGWGNALNKVLEAAVGEMKEAKQ